MNSQRAEIMDAQKAVIDYKNQFTQAGFPVKAACSVVFIDAQGECPEIGVFCNPEWPIFYEKLGYDSHSVLALRGGYAMVFNDDSKSPVNIVATDIANREGIIRDLGIEIRGNVLMLDVEVLDAVFASHEEACEWMAMKLTDAVYEKAEGDSEKVKQLTIALCEKLGNWEGYPPVTPF